MEAATVDIGLVRANGRIRAADPKKVKAIADSIAEVGLMNPITVYRCEVIHEGQKREGFGVIAGLHRLEACKSLGLAEIQVQVADLGEHERTIAECDENLCGTNLSPAEVAMFTAKRKAAYEALHPETQHGGDRKSSRQLGDTKSERFTADTAAKTKLSERAIQRSASRGSAICEDALSEVRGSKLDTGVYLDQLKRLPPERQLDRVRHDLERMNRKPVPAPEDERSVHERQVAALMSAWNRAGPEARREFLDQVS